MFRNGIGCKCIPQTFLPAVSTLWSADAAARASKMKYCHFPVICHFSVSSCYDWPPRCWEASDLFQLLLLHPKSSQQWHEYSNQTSILNLASVSALQMGNPMTLVPDMPRYCCCHKGGDLPKGDLWMLGFCCWIGAILCKVKSKSHLSFRELWGISRLAQEKPWFSFEWAPKWSSRWMFGWRTHRWSLNVGLLHWSYIVQVQVVFELWGFSYLAQLNRNSNLGGSVGKSESKYWPLQKSFFCH